MTLKQKLESVCALDKNVQGVTDWGKGFIQRHNELAPILTALIDVAEEHAALIATCEWYANNPLEHERNHFFAVEARGNHGQALERLEKLCGEGM